MRRSLILALPFIFVMLSCSSLAPGRSRASGVIPIMLVQGEAHWSPRVGETVTIEGTVTAVRRERVTGFWIEDSWAGDHDSRVAEAWLRANDDRVLAPAGIFVKTAGEPTVEVGESWRVTGEVVEFERPGSLPVTQIRPSKIEAAASARLMPSPVRIGPSALAIPETIDDDGLEIYQPREDAIDFWESLEGTLVEIRHATVTGPTNRFGDFVIVPTGSVRDATRTARGGILIRPDDENTERLIVDQSLLPSRVVVSVGDQLAGPVRGVIHYDFGNYRLMATELGPVRKVTRERLPLPPVSQDALRIATYNVLNLSAADDQERFDQVARSIVDDLEAPDIIALQEIQDDTAGDDDGVVSAVRTMGRLVEAIRGAGGPSYEWRQIDPIDNADGGAPGANIRVAYLINPERVAIVDRRSGRSDEEVAIEGSGIDVRLSMNPGRIGTRSDCFLGEGSSDESEGTRKSLAIELTFRGETYFLINNHLKSKRGDDGLYGSVQPPKRHTEDQRRCQAEVVASVAREIVRRDPDASVIVLGDMNEHEFRDPMQPFENAGLVNMMERVPLEQRYSYNYLGNSQVLDNAFVSASLADRSRLIPVHVNSDAPDSSAASDHDPLLLVISPPE